MASEHIADYLDPFASSITKDQVKQMLDKNKAPQSVKDVVDKMEQDDFVNFSDFVSEYDKA